MVTLSIYFLFMVCLAFLWVRNGKVCKFGHMVIDLSYDYCVKTSYKLDGFELYFEKLPSYYKILFSFKRLKLESFFTKEEIEELLHPSL